MRLIDADALLESLSKKDSEVHIGLVFQLIDSMPTIKREWVGLSDDEVNQIHKEHHIYIPTIKKIEAKLKELNYE